MTMEYRSSRQITPCVVILSRRCARRSGPRLPRSRILVVGSQTGKAMILIPTPLRDSSLPRVSDVGNFTMAH
jgi:hypothetical protein